MIALSYRQSAISFQQKHLKTNQAGWQLTAED